MTSSSLTHLRSLLADRDRLRKTAIALAGTVAVASLTVSGFVLILRQLGAWQGAELSAYDRLVRLRPAEAVDDRVVVVGISETDIQTRQEYPIADGTLAELLAKLNTYQPRGIGIDIARDIPQGEGRAALLQELQRGDRIIAACLLSSISDPGLPAPEGVPPERIGFADLPQDPGGVIRRSILVSTPAATTTPPPSRHLCNDASPDNQLVSLSFGLAILYLQSEDLIPEQTETGDIQIGSTGFLPLTEGAGGYQQSGASDYQIMLNYRAPEAIRQISLSDVLAGQFDPNWVKDRVVLIGYTSEVAKDVFYTPFSGGEDDQTMPGVAVHAQNVSQILSAVLDQRPLIWYWGAGWEMLWIGGWAITGGAIAWAVRRPWLFVLLEAAALGSLLGLCYLLLLQGGWVPLVPAAIALVMTAGGVLLLDRTTREGYTQAIYEQAKDQIQIFLQPKIAIDHEKKARQVEEITDTSYFKDLLQRAKTIREQRALEAKKRQQESDRSDSNQ